MDRRASRLNRTGLTLLGLVLLVVGGTGLALGLGAFGGGRSSQPVLSDRTRHFASDHGWYWPVVAAVAFVLALLGLLWLLRQGRSHRIRGLSMEPDDGAGTTSLSSKAVSDALEDEIEEYPGVGRARARVMGSDKRPKLLLNVAYGERADLAELRSRIAGDAVPRMCGALERDSLPAIVKLRLVPTKETRTVA